MNSEVFSAAPLQRKETFPSNYS